MTIIAIYLENTSNLENVLNYKKKLNLLQNFDTEQIFRSYNKNIK